jgi:hypothetical protein
MDICPDMEVGDYNLIDDEDKIIRPMVWDTLVEPGGIIKIRMNNYVPDNTVEVEVSFETKVRQ